MKKREFQKKTTVQLLKRLAAVCEELGENPNVTVSSKFHSSYFKLRKDYNLIQISVKQTGELSYQLTDMLGSTGGKQIYYEYGENDDFTRIIEKFSDDFARLYKDFLLSGTLHEINVTIIDLSGVPFEVLSITVSLISRCKIAQQTN